MHNTEVKKEKKKGIAAAVKFIGDAGLMGSNLLMSGMLLIIMMNTVLRYVVGAPVYWGDTLMTWMMILMVYMGLASAVASGSNLRMTALIDRLSVGKQNILAAFCSVLNVVYFVILVWAGIGKTKNSYATQGFDLGTDWHYWPPQAIMVVGVAIGLMACIVVAVEKFNILKGRKVKKDEEEKVDLDSSLVNE
jgi:TRAP-type C4-dicarboxylate transport system permease small subunit